MKTETKKARFLHQESREYRGLPRVQDYKTRANRVERRTLKQKLTADDGSEVALDELLATIAKEKLHIDTLETQSSDSLDFHDVAVWSVKAALEAAYRAGLAAAKEER